jgi:hypothetical protein
MSDPTSAAPPPIPAVPTNIKPKRKWRWWQTVLAVIAGIVLVFKIIGSYDPVSLQVQMDRNGSLVVTNTGTKPIEIQKATVNDRKDCEVYRAGFQTLATFKPMTLNVGDRALVTSFCNIVRVTFETNVGSSTYTFSR